MRYTEIFKEARRLYDLGFACHWLHARSKRPVESGWGSGPRKEWDYLAETYSAPLNLGVRLGAPSKIDRGYLAVVDVDIKSTERRHRDEALAAVSTIIGAASCPEVRSGRGNGSRHFYFLSERPFKTFNPAQSTEVIKVHQPSKKPSKAELKALTEAEIESGVRLSRAWEVSLYSDGRQVVLPPSVHPDSGELYRWKRPLTAVRDLPLIDVQGAIDGSTGVDGVASGAGIAANGGLKGKAVKNGLIVDEDPFGVAGGSEREALLAPERSEGATLQGFKVERVDLGWLDIIDEVRDAIVEGKGVTDRSGYLLKASSALISAGLSQNEVLTVLTDPDTFLGACGYDHAKTKSRRRAAEWVYRYTFKKVASERSAEGVFGKASEMPTPRKLTEEEMETQALEFAEDRDWRQDLDRTKEGRAKTTLKNLDLIFSNAVDGDPFIEDLFASRIEYGCDTPWGGKAMEYIKDIDMLLVKRWMADTEFQIEPSKDAILEATAVVAHRKRIHPVREWLSSLKWDGVKRIDTWIKDFCQGVAEEPYLSEASRKFLLAMVKRVFEPGCQWDYVLVLEGLQGKYKSSAARVLAGDKWFMDNLPDLKDKDSMLNLQGKWLIELGELANVKRTDFNLVKAYLVRRTDTVRPHYGRLVADVPRQSVFIGTVNEGQYLKDPTGNRRYWPVKVGICDVKGLAVVRDQLFAEAMHVYRTTNEILMMGPEAMVQATEAQEDRRIDDDETEMREALLEYMANPKTTFNFEEGFKARHLFVGPGAPWAAWAKEKYSLNTAASVLRNLGFESKKTHGQRLWKKSGAPAKNGGAPRCPGAPENDENDDFDFR